MDYLTDLVTTPWPMYRKVALAEIVIVTCVVAITWYVNARAGLFLLLGLASMTIFCMLLILMRMSWTGQLGPCLNSVSNACWALLGSVLDLFMLPLRFARCVRDTLLRDSSNDALKASEEGLSKHSVLDHPANGSQDSALISGSVSVFAGFRPGALYKTVQCLWQKVHEKLSVKPEYDSNILRVDSKQAVGLVENPGDVESLQDVSAPQAVGLVENPGDVESLQDVSAPQVQLRTSPVKDRCVFREGYTTDITFGNSGPKSDASGIFLYPHVKLMLDAAGNGIEDKDAIRPVPGNVYPHIRCGLYAAGESFGDTVGVDKESSIHSYSELRAAADVTEVEVADEATNKINSDDETHEEGSTCSCSKESSDSLGEMSPRSSQNSFLESSPEARPGTPVEPEPQVDLTGLQSYPLATPVKAFRKPPAGASPTSEDVSVSFSLSPSLADLQCGIRDVAEVAIPTVQSTENADAEPAVSAEAHHEADRTGKCSRPESSGEAFARALDAYNHNAM